MAEVTISRQTAQRSLDALRNSGAEAPGAMAFWVSLVEFFEADGLAVAVNFDRDYISPIIAETGEAIAASLNR